MCLVVDRWAKRRNGTDELGAGGDVARFLEWLGLKKGCTLGCQSLVLDTVKAKQVHRATSGQQCSATSESEVSALHLGVTGNPGAPGLVTCAPA